MKSIWPRNTQEEKSKNKNYFNGFSKMMTSEEDIICQSDRIGSVLGLFSRAETSGISPNHFIFF